jgi:hypothetical protein
VGEAAYVHDVHRGWVLAQASLENSCSFANQALVTPDLRGVLTEWMWALSYRARVSADAIVLGVQLHVQGRSRAPQQVPARRGDLRFRRRQGGGRRESASHKLPEVVWGHLQAGRRHGV